MIATRKTTIICKLCRVRIAARNPHSQYCEGCGYAMRNAQAEAKKCGTDYPVYRLEMRFKYGKGPWRPNRVLEEDRWQAWSKRRGA